jgi:hypothetical protein
MPSTHRLTKSELNILRALKAQEDGTLNAYALRKELKLSIRGFALILGRMQDRRQVARFYDASGKVSITLGGISALNKHLIEGN